MPVITFKKEGNLYFKLNLADSMSTSQGKQAASPSAKRTNLSFRVPYASSSPFKIDVYYCLRPSTSWRSPSLH